MAGSAHGEHLRWWQTWGGAAAIAALCAIPLLWPPIPPLLDLPGHMAGYKVAIDLAHSAELQRYFGLDWSVIGNLGLELLVPLLAKLVGLELAVKLIVLCIPPLTAAGFLWVAREVHGRVAPTALFAVPLAFGYPFQFGFVNFVFAMALCFLAFGLWLWLGRRGRPGLRAALFVPLAAIVWLAHVFGWAVLGVLAFSDAWVREKRNGQAPVEAALRAAATCLVLVAPVLLTLIWRSDAAGNTEGWFQAGAKLHYLLEILRDRWQWIDLPSALLLYGLIALAAWRRWMAPGLARAATILLTLYLLLPQMVFGSSYADMRLGPFVVAVALLAIQPRREMPWLAAAGIAFFALRIGVETVSLGLFSQAYQRELVALDSIPRGARLISFVGTPCRRVWHWDRLDHLPAMATVRREAFSNEQWSLHGAQIDSVIYVPAGDFRIAPSQNVPLAGCTYWRWGTLDAKLRAIPRAAFDYVWLIAPPPYDRALVKGMVPVWTNGHSTVLRIVDHRQPPAAAVR